MELLLTGHPTLDISVRRGTIYISGASADFRLGDSPEERKKTIQRIEEITGKRVIDVNDI